MIKVEQAQQLDKQAVKRAFSEAAANYDSFATLQRTVGKALLNKYPVEAKQGMLLDMGSGTGFLSQEITQQKPDQAIIGLDIAFNMLQTSKNKFPSSEWFYICADAEYLPFKIESLQYIYSNLALQWCQDLLTLFKQVKAVLKPKGQLVFSTFGEDSLYELKTAWAAVDDYVHVNHFYGAEQIADLLAQAGYTHISCETLVYPCIYTNIWSLMHELKGLGAQNANTQRNKRPTTRQQLNKMIANYPALQLDGKLVASYEIIYVKAIA